MNAHLVKSWKGWNKEDEGKKEGGLTKKGQSSSPFKRETSAATTTPMMSRMRFEEE